MSSVLICGVETRTGGYCRNEAGRCPVHEARANAASAPEPRRERNLRAIGWWLLDGLVKGGIEPREASAMAAVMRIMASLGPEPADQSEAWREAALRGRMMHGMPPRDEEEWDLMRSIFSPEVVAEFEGYAARLTGVWEGGVEED